MSSTDLTDRLFSHEKSNERVFQLYFAIGKTVEDHIGPLIERVDNLKSYWLALEDDLKYILKRDFGDYFGELSDTEEGKRVYLWGVYETPFYKHSLDIINHATARLNLVPNCVVTFQYYWNSVDNYSPANYFTKPWIEANGLDLEDFVALSEITIRFDEYNLAKSGQDVESARDAIEVLLAKTLPYHIQVTYVIMENIISRPRSVTLGNCKHVYQTITMN